MAQEPLYQRIAEDLRKQIDDGTLAPGSLLPTEIELGERYVASRNTVRDAIKRLTGQGLIETRPGQGTFVTMKVDPFVTVLTVDSIGIGGGEGATYLSKVRAEHRTASMTTPRVEVQNAPDAIARRLRVPANTQLVSRHQQRFIDGVPWSLQTSFYPMEFIARGATRLLMAEDISEGTAQYLANVVGVSQTGYRDWITARRPDANEQSFFRIPHDSMVFEIFRTGFDQHKTPIRVTVTVFPTDRNQFIVNVGDDLPDLRYGEDSLLLRWQRRIEPGHVAAEHRARPTRLPSVAPSAGGSSIYPRTGACSAQVVASTQEKTQCRSSSRRLLACWKPPSAGGCNAGTCGRQRRSGVRHAAG
jgi:GntR family transcriptional regulator